MRPRTGTRITTIANELAFLYRKLIFGKFYITIPFLFGILCFFNGLRCSGWKRIHVCVQCCVTVGMAHINGIAKTILILEIHPSAGAYTGKFSLRRVNKSKPM